jgi:hypothetical protein
MTKLVEKLTKEKKEMENENTKLKEKESEHRKNIEVLENENVQFLKIKQKIQKIMLYNCQNNSVVFEGFFVTDLAWWTLLKDLNRDQGELLEIAVCYSSKSKKYKRIVLSDIVSKICSILNIDNPEDEIIIYFTSKTAVMKFHTTEFSDKVMCPIITDYFPTPIFSELSVGYLCSSIIEEITKRKLKYQFKGSVNQLKISFVDAYGETNISRNSVEGRFSRGLIYITKN